MTLPAEGLSDDPTEPLGTGGAFRTPVLALAVLTLVAGFFDGYALSTFDVFIANQSGNIVRVGMGIFGEYSAWDLAVIAIAGFTAGATIAWLLAMPARRLDWSLVRVRLAAATIALVLWWAIAALTDGDPHGYACAILGSVSMGILASVLTRIADTPVQATFQTATLLNGSRGVIQWILGSDALASAGRRMALLGLMSITCYAVGGALGAFGAKTGTTSLIVGIVVVVATLVLTLQDRRAPQIPAG